MPDPSRTSRQVERWVGDLCRREGDELVAESPLELRLGDRPVAVTMRTPGHDEELAAGFFLTEGVIGRGEELESVARCPHAGAGDVMVVRLAGDREGPAAELAGRAMYMSSSCGVCGKQSIERVRLRLRAIVGGFTVTPAVLRSLPDRLRSAQATFDRTGALHAAGLFTVGGEPIVVREDVGRHNAVDKAVGHELLRGRTPIDPAVMLVSGRVGFEVIQKAAMAGIAVVAAVGAPSDLAAELAEEAGVTLVGFLRGERFNVYTHPRRVAASG